jgi:hypothetical protein
MDAGFQGGTAGLWHVIRHDTAVMLQYGKGILYDSESLYAKLWQEHLHRSPGDVCIAFALLLQGSTCALLMCCPLLALAASICMRKLDSNSLVSAVSAGAACCCCCCCCCHQGASSTTICSTSELQLLRALLQRNARRMKPTKWQRQHLPLGPNSHWMASFICPVYPEVLGDSATFMDGIPSNLMKEARAALEAAAGSNGGSSSRLVRHSQSGAGTGRAAAAAAKKEAASAAEGTCRVCGCKPGSRSASGAVVQKLMRCSRCNSDADRYCPAQCQHADWQRHKRTCSSK